MDNYPKEFLTMLNTYYGAKEIWDTELDILRMQQEIAILEDPKVTYPPKNTAYFSPSSVNSCKRELYIKVKHQLGIGTIKRDEHLSTPLQKRWTSIGTRVGEEVQTALLKIEKHYGKTFGKGHAPFIPARTAEGYPMWENFSKRFVSIPYKGKTINLFGMCDGIIKHKESGDYCGIEVKSKSTTPAQTSYYSMKEEKEDHRKQVIAYSLMYKEFNLENYLVLYWNVAKKGWNADAADDPDVRVFNVEITEEEQLDLLETLYQVLVSVELGNPPKLDLTKWAFNNFKTACALDLSSDEVDELKEQVRRIKASSQPQYLKNSYFEAMKQIVDIRKEFGK